MQAMPVTGVRMPANYHQEGQRRLDDLRPGVQSDRVQLHRVVRARTVCTNGGYHGIHTPSRPRSE